MNTNTRTVRNRKSQISYQSAEAAVEVEGVEPASNFVEENEFGKILRSTFEKCTIHFNWFKNILAII